MFVKNQNRVGNVEGLLGGGVKQVEDWKEEVCCWRRLGFNQSRLVSAEYGGCHWVNVRPIEHIGVVPY